MANNVKAIISIQPIFNFEGFCVQKGMIFGTRKHQNFVTNGTLFYNNNCPYYNVYFQNYDMLTCKYEWIKIPLYLDTDKPLFNAIYKAVNSRESKNIKKEYLSTNDIETIRWGQDENKRHFQAHDPLSTPKVIGCKSPKSSAVYNSIKERTTLTQRINTVRYCSGDSYTII